MESITYDYAIIGAGAAGLQLCMAMIADPFFREKKILLIDKEEKEQNDRTWCYWETGTGKWDHLIRHSWETGYFYSTGFEKRLDLRPYRYKMLRAIDFYSWTKKDIHSRSNVSWTRDDVTSIQQGDPVIILGNQKNYKARQVFDSRIHPDFFAENDPYLRLLQHFKGWVIRTAQEEFDPSVFTMMDFRLKWKNTTSFTYVLPVSSREALVEYTLFSSELLNDEDYEVMLASYLETYLKLGAFKIIEKEKGIIPMSNFPFTAYHQERITKIGTAGSWVKPSTGYSFKNCEKNSLKIIQNLKSGNDPSEGLISRKHRVYDTVFLDVLFHRNEMGEEVFTDMYRKNDIRQIFRFLDEASGLFEDLNILHSFRSGPFLSSVIAQRKQLISQKF